MTRQRGVRGVHSGGRNDKGAILPSLRLLPPPLPLHLHQHKRQHQHRRQHLHLHPLLAVSLVAFLSAPPSLHSLVLPLPQPLSLILLRACVLLLVGLLSVSSIRIPVPQFRLCVGRTVVPCSLPMQLPRASRLTVGTPGFYSMRAPRTLSLCMSHTVCGAKVHMRRFANHGRSHRFDATWTTRH